MEEKFKIVAEDMEEMDEVTMLTLSILQDASNMEGAERKQFIESLMVNAEVRDTFIASCLKLLKINNEFEGEAKKADFIPEKYYEGVTMLSDLIKEAISIATNTNNGLTHEDIVLGMTLNEIKANPVKVDFDADVKTVKNSDNQPKKRAEKNLGTKPAKSSKVRENVNIAPFQKQG